MKKIIFLILILIFSTNIYADTYVPISKAGFYTVTKVIDGEALEVKDIANNTISRIKLIGINTKGYTNAYLYMNNTLLGKSVYLTQDSGDEKTSGRWSLVYLTYNGINYNEELVRLGYAVATKTTSNDSVYNNYANIQYMAENNHNGMWADNSLGSNNYYSNDKAININTANKEELVNGLSYCNNELSQKIIAYRKENPFNQINEIKFVPDFTYSIYKDNISFMHVSTNINKSQELEINSLDGVTNYITEDIIEYRNEEGNITWADLEDDNIISNSIYTKNKYYVSSSDIIFIDKIYGDKSVNINLASKEQIDSIGFSTSESVKIKNYLDKGYTIKTKEELKNIKGIILTNEEFNKLEDNFNVMTNINNCSTYEIGSLFGNNYSSKEVNKIQEERPFNKISDLEDIIGTSKYNKIKSYIYIDDENDYETNYVNLNTASKKQLENIGITSSKVNEILNSSSITSYDKIPTNISSNDREITLYTNINKASKEELMTLDITEDIANQIIRYRNEFLFASNDELKYFFKNIDNTDLYNQIADYIVYR